VEEGVCGRQWRIPPLQRPGQSYSCVGVLYTAEANFGSCAHYIDADGGAHCPLIKELPPIRTWRGGLGHFD
jgi:hypothetical protein